MRPCQCNDSLILFPEYSCEKLALIFGVARLEAELPGVGRVVQWVVGNEEAVIMQCHLVHKYIWMSHGLREGNN